MKDAKQFLDMCRRRFPSTRPHQSHSLTLRDDTLVLTLMLGDTCQQFNIHKSDFEKGPSELLDEVVKLFKKPRNVPKPPDSVA